VMLPGEWLQAFIPLHKNDLHSPSCQRNATNDKCG
jgi:hypothetical protein